MGHVVLLAPGEHIEKQGLRLKETLKDMLPDDDEDDEDFEFIDLD